ncbi:hypothetical protein [Microbulbifer sp. JTAC008]|uniref:hypothetical protein n=1 Tax=unclassified Microbulbifer TaxID=2619833 RepID=UPI0040396C89
MISRAFTLFLISFSIMACSNKQTTPQVSESEISPTKVHDIYLMPVIFSDPSNLDKVKNECSMLEMLENSIINFASDHQLNFEYLESEAKISTDAIRVKVEFTEVIPHRWTFMAVRPSSTASFRISIYQNGKLSSEITKSIGSGMAFGACDRLEKISTATGRYVNKWVSRQI